MFWDQAAAYDQKVSDQQRLALTDAERLAWEAIHWPGGGLRLKSLPLKTEEAGQLSQKHLLQRTADPSNCLAIVPEKVADQIDLPDQRSVPIALADLNLAGLALADFVAVAAESAAVAAADFAAGVATIAAADDEGAAAAVAVKHAASC